MTLSLEDTRLKLLSNGYIPVPCAGKAPVFKQWQKLEPTPLEIERWPRVAPAATNTGVMTRGTPTLDIDLTNPEAATAVENLVRERFEEHGYVLARFGRPPRRAIPFRTDQPFPKLKQVFGDPDTPERDCEKLELLADGQQFIVDGIHPDTLKPYSWHGGSLLEIPRKELPYIHPEEAQALVDDAVKLLVEQFDYRLRSERPKPNGKGNGEDHAGADWSFTPDDLMDHDRLTALAGSLVASGMSAGAAVNLLRCNVAGLVGVDEERRGRRLTEIPNMVKSATKPASGESAATPVNGAVYTFRWHGEAYDGPLKEWLVEGMLPRIGKALIAGQWGTYKTFVALDLAGAVMTKTTFAGRPVNYQGGVLFIATEGQDEVRVRLEALARDKLAEPGEREDTVSVDSARLPFVWIETCPRLTADDASKELRKIVEAAQKEMQTRFGLPLVLIIIDTLLPAAGFKDANDAAEVQRAMTVLTDVALFSRALVATVDHFGKDVSTGTRNSSVKEDAADAILALLGERDLTGVVSNPRMALRKIKGGPAGQEIHFETRTVTVEGPTGFDTATALVIDWRIEGDPFPKPKQRWSKSLAIFKRALDFALSDTGVRMRPFPDGPEVLAVKRDAIRMEFIRAYPADSRKAKDKAFERCERDAVASGLAASREMGPLEASTTYFWSLG
jgi:hypothetical protein